MPKVFSEGFRQVMHETGPSDQPVYLLSIYHPLMSEPARVVNDTASLVGPGGHTYVGAAFRFKAPDEGDKQLTRATLQVDNVSRELMDWIELSRGGRGAGATLMIVRRGAPTVIEDQWQFEIKDLSVDVQNINVELGYRNLLTMPAIAVRHDPLHTPGIY